MNIYPWLLNVNGLQVIQFNKFIFLKSIDSRHKNAWIFQAFK